MRRVAPDRPGLPETVQLGDVELELGPAPLRDDEARQYSETEHEPFDVKRLVERDVVLGEHEFRVRVLVSLGETAIGNVTAKTMASGDGAVRGGPGGSPPPIATAAYEDPHRRVRVTDRSSRGYDSPHLDLLLEALGDATD